MVGGQVQLILDNLPSSIASVTGERLEMTLATSDCEGSEKGQKF